MLDKLETQVIEMLPDLQKALQAGLEYGGDLFERFISYNIAISSVWIGICFVFTIISSLFVAWSVKKYRDINWEGSAMGKFDRHGVFIFFSSVFLLTSLFSLLIPIFDIMKAIYLPEVLVIDYFK